MRARRLAAAALAVLGGACANVRPMTQADREQASVKVMEKPHGTVLTEGELSKLDLDRTFVCEVEAQVGSHIPRYQCRSLRRVERERAEALGFVFDGSGNMYASSGGLPHEPSGTTAAAALMATNGNKAVKEERPNAADPRSEPSPESEPTANQDPRFPPL